MSLSVTKRPRDYSAALEPIVYKLQRKDRAFNTITNNGGTIRITVNGADVRPDWVIGDSIYIRSDDGVYDVFGTITNSTFPAGNTLIDVNVTYTANAGTGFINNLSRKTSYRALINLYNPTNNALLIADSIGYSPDSYGVINVDVQVIKSLIQSKITCVAPLLDTVSDTDKFISFYIGFTETYTGFTGSETQDSSNVKNAIFGDMTINGDNDYLTRIPSRILSVASKLRAFIGKYMDLSFYGLSSQYTINVEHYDVTGSLTTTDTIIADTGICRTGILPAATDKKILAKVINSFTILAGTSWTNFGVALAFTKAASTLSANITASQTYIAEQPCVGVDLTTFSPITFSVNISGVWTGTITVTVFIDNVVQEYRFASTSQTTNGTYPLVVQPSSTAGSSLGSIEKIRITANGAGGNTGTANVVITIPNGQVVTFAFSQQEIEVVEACERPVTLAWNNRIGGVDWWTFKYNQEISYNFTDVRKIRRLRLRAENLTYEQWQMVNGLNTIGEIYNRSYSEQDFKVRGKQRKVDNQAYLLLDDLSLLEVIVNPTVNVTQTKQNSHNVDITIELPDGFEGNNFMLEWAGRSKRFIGQLLTTNFQPGLRDDVVWEIWWFGSVVQTLKTSDIPNAAQSILYEQRLPLPDEPMNIELRIRKVSQHGIAMASGSIQFSKDGVAFTSLNKTFAAGDDVSEYRVIMPAVDATAVNPNDRINISIFENV